MYVAGLALLAVFVLAQLPAVLYLGRYLEREEGDPPPAVWFHGDGVARRRRAAPVGTPDRALDRASARAPDRDDGAVAVIPASEAAAATRDRRRCPTCGADNPPGVVTCHGCLKGLPPAENGRES